MHIIDSENPLLSISGIHSTQSPTDFKTYQPTSIAINTESPTASPSETTLQLQSDTPSPVNLQPLILRHHYLHKLWRSNQVYSN